MKKIVSVFLFALLVLPSIAFAQSMRVEVLVINGLYFPLNQFHVAGPDVCPAQHYHAHVRVYSIDNQGMLDPNPTGCGFGQVSDVQKTVIDVTDAQASAYVGPALVEAPVGGLTFPTPNIILASQGTSAQPVGAVQTGLLVLAALIVVASAPLLGYLPYAPRLILHFFVWFFGLAKKQKKERYWGTVYDSISKEPLGLSIVRVFEKVGGRLLLTEVADRRGRFSFLLAPGTYALETVKPGYLFPSKIVTGKKDWTFEHVFDPHTGLAVQKDTTVFPDVPLDPLDLDKLRQTSSGVKKLILVLQGIGDILAIPLLVIGLAISLWSLVALPTSVLNWVLAVVYAILLAAQLVLRVPRRKPWGIVADASTKSPLPLASVQLIDPQFNKILMSRLSDYRGRYNFLAQPGTYVLKAAKAGYQQQEAGGYKIRISRAHEQVNADLLLKK